MSRAVVERIFWKELRTLGSLWLTVACFAFVLEFAIAFVLAYQRPWWIPEKMLTTTAGTFLAAYLAATLYAIATASASFTSERDSTKSLFQIIPIRSLDAFTGKWSFGLASTAALLVTLGSIAFLACTTVGSSFRAAFAWNVANQPAISFGTEMAILLPVEVFAVCSFFSLLFAEVLLAAACGTFVSVVALCGWWIAPMWINLLFIASIAIADFWLTGRWLRRGPLVASESVLGIDVPNPLNLIRRWQPATAWRRSVQCLVWKELRQVAPLVLLGIIAAALTALHTAFYPRVNNPNASTMFLNWTAHWSAFLLIPLLMGLISYNTEHRGHAFRLAGERGLSPFGTWALKHLIWASLAFIVCGFLLLCDRWAAAWAFDGFGRWPAHWAAPDYLVSALAQAMTPATLSGTRLPVVSPAFPRVIGTLSLYVIAVYSIGQFCSFMTPKTVVSLGAGIGGTALVCFCWAILLRLGLPIIWTIGVVPPSSFWCSRYRTLVIGNLVLHSGTTGETWCRGRCSQRS